MSSTNLLGEGPSTVSLAPVFTLLSSGTEHQVRYEIIITFVFEHLLTRGSGHRPSTYNGNVTVQSWDGWCGNVVMFLVITGLTSVPGAAACQEYQRNFPPGGPSLQ